MFEKCIKCDNIGDSCHPYLNALPFDELVQWCNKRQKYLGWTNQTLADKSNVPLSTINRIKAGDYPDCKYSTMKNILNALVGASLREPTCPTPEAEHTDNKVAVDYLLNQIERLRKEVDAWREENERKAKIIDKFLEK